VVLGELVAGLIVGVSGLGLVNPGAAGTSLLAQVGVTLLLFEVGLNLTLAFSGRSSSFGSGFVGNAFALWLTGDEVRRGQTCQLFVVMPL